MNSEPRDNLPPPDRDHEPESTGAMPTDQPGDDDLSPIELEPLRDDPGATADVEPAAASASSKLASDLDVCPNCGASLPGDDDVVCMRCGFDLRTLKPLQTDARTAPVDDAADTGDGVGEAIASSSRPMALLSGGMLAVAWVVLLVGFFLGVRALMPGAELRVIEEGDSETARAIIPPVVRLVSFLKLLVLSGTWLACATAGLALFSRLVERPFGDLRAALLHLAAIVSTMQLARFIGIPTRSIEWTVEVIVQLLIFLGLSLVLLRLSRHDVITFAMITVVVVLCLFFGSHVLAWAMSA